MDLDGLLRFAVEQGASDVHLKVGSRPRLRVDGRLREGPFDTVEPTDTERLVAAVKRHELPHHESAFHGWLTTRAVCSRVHTIQPQTLSPAMADALRQAKTPEDQVYFGGTYGQNSLGAKG